MVKPRKAADVHRVGVDTIAADVEGLFRTVGERL
jgi:hypothetical protein